MTLVKHYSSHYVSIFGIEKDGNQCQVSDLQTCQSRVLRCSEIVIGL